jgi:hypothetical protein
MSQITTNYETFNMNVNLQSCIAAFFPHPARAVPRAGWLVCSVLAVMFSFSDLQAQYGPGSLPWCEPGPGITWGWVNKVYRSSAMDFKPLVDMASRYGASDQMRGEFSEARRLFQLLGEELRYHDPQAPSFYDGSLVPIMKPGVCQLSSATFRPSTLASLLTTEVHNNTVHNTVRDTVNETKPRVSTPAVC